MGSKQNKQTVWDKLMITHFIYGSLSLKGVKCGCMSSNENYVRIKMTLAILCIFIELGRCIFTTSR